MSTHAPSSVASLALGILSPATSPTTASTSDLLQRHHDTWPTSSRSTPTPRSLFPCCPQPWVQSSSQSPPARLGYPVYEREVFRRTSEGGAHEGVEHGGGLALGVGWSCLAGRQRDARPHLPQRIAAKLHHSPPRSPNTPFCRVLRDSPYKRIVIVSCSPETYRIPALASQALLTPANFLLAKGAAAPIPSGHLSQNAPSHAHSHPLRHLVISLPPISSAGARPRSGGYPAAASRGACSARRPAQAETWRYALRLGGIPKREGEVTRAAAEEGYLHA
ncbi:hypothetical protein B0H12DRAFT_1229053 [Mycena haematopus]|nr:hypothetical protein B0H12DRAFT_1229053 [Mycena haematopus]